ncbi:MAG TPA: alkaline phosphatase D family protein [Chthoniobacteraceae bacterium]|nr:alkaline phosphatase D family protein [Chthoniobacteraceae bacterium]
MTAAFALALARRDANKSAQRVANSVLSAKRVAPSMWVGGVTNSSAVIKAYLGVGMRGQLVVREVGNVAPALRFDIASAAKGSAIGSAHLTGLQSSVQYEYSLEVEGRRVSLPRGRFKTFPSGVASFQFAFASCARTGSAHQVFTTIRNKEPLFFLHLGDLHYSNIAKDKPALFRAAFDSVFTSATQSQLYREVPLAYVWDDHDFGPNNSDSLAPGRRSARVTYQEYIPHYPLGAGAGDVPIYQAFSVGRVRFLLLDVRSERSPADVTDGPRKTLLGSVQKAWLKQELLATRDGAKLTFIGSPIPWIGAGRANDGWAGYAFERRELAQFIAAHQLKNVCFLCGDAHMLAADDGRESGYAGTAAAPIPVLHGSALDRGASFKGGPYSHGYYLPKQNEGCFGWVEVRDEGARIAVDFSGRTHRDEPKIRLSFDCTI